MNRFRSIVLLVTAMLSASLVAFGQAAPLGRALAPMDKLSVVVVQDPVQGRPVEVSVSPLGDLTIPVSRCCESSVTINVQGKTVEQAEQEIKQRLEAEFYEMATVQLKLVDATRRKGQVLLRGAVRGNLVLLEPGKAKTLWEALTEVGTTEFANLRKVKLDRLDPSGGNQRPDLGAQVLRQR